MKSTVHDLPDEIEKLVPPNERTPLINQILFEARQGEFHNYRNEKYDCGKVQVVSMLRQTNDKRLQPIIDGIMNGDYDETANEDEVAAMKNDWIKGGGTLESWNKLFAK